LSMCSTSFAPSASTTAPPSCPATSARCSCWPGVWL
jgi:hypothetical protein